MDKVLTGRDIIVVSPQRWSNMWVSKHWISHELSRSGNRVLFVGPPIWIGGALRKPIGSDIVKRLFHEYSGKVNSNLYLFSAILKPSFAAKTLDHEEMEVCRQLKSRLSSLNFKAPILLNFGTNHHILDYIEADPKIYYCVDPPFPTPGQESFELRTCQKSDMIFAISETYKETLQAMVPDKPIHVVPHGYDFELADRVRQLNTPKPSDLQGISSPIVGYTGSIHDAYVDTQLLSFIAKENPHINFVLVGPYKNNPIGASLSESNYEILRKISNVHFLGQKHHNELPGYIKHFNACVILHEIKEQAEIAKTTQRTPFKLLHYLSQGKPIITPPLFELGPLESLLYIAKNMQEYSKAVRCSLDEAPDLVDKRIQYAEQFSYAKTLVKLSKYIDQGMNK